MVAKLSVVVALAMFIYYASAEPETFVPPSSLPLSYYPLDTKAYIDLKKSIYALNQAINNMCFNCQGANEYYSLYNSKILNQLKLDEKLDKLNKSQKIMDDQYQKYQQALANYKAELALKSVAYNDGVPIDSALLQ